MRHVLKKIGQPHKRHTVVAGREKTVSTVRNPFDLLVSWWLIIGERQGYSNFGDFITNCRDPFMVRREKLFYFLETDYILRFENLEEDLNNVLRKHRIRTIKLPHYNATEDKKHFTQYYNDVTRSLVIARFSAEIERFGYGCID